MNKSIPLYAHAPKTGGWVSIVETDQTPCLPGSLLFAQGLCHNIKDRYGNRLV